MTEQLKTGDRVHVEFDGVVTAFDGSFDGTGGFTVVVRPDGAQSANHILPEFVTRLEPVLPTKIGAVIRARLYGGSPDVFALLADGHWTSETQQFWPDDGEDQVTNVEILYGGIDS